MGDSGLYSLLTTLIHVSTVFVVVGVAGELVFGIWQGKVHNRLEAKQQAELAARDERAATAEKKVTELLEGARQREVSGEQRARLIEILRPFAGGHVLITEPHNDAEASTYAKQLDEVLEAAGIQLEHVIAADFDQTPYGLTLRFKPGPPPINSRTPSVAALLAAFKSAGLDVDVGPADTNAPIGVVELRVGSKKR